MGVVAIALSGILAEWTPIPGEASAFWRMLIAAAVLFAVVAPSRPARLPLPATALRILAGVFFGADIALFHIALQITSVANATLLAHVAPLWVALGVLVVIAPSASCSDHQAAQVNVLVEQLCGVDSRAANESR